MFWKVYKSLFSIYGPQNWWPAQTPFEVCVGAILTQNTAWKNVEKAINNLKEKKLLSPDRLLKVPTEQLEQIISPAGFYRQKARYLINFCKFLEDVGGLENLKAKEIQELRELLLSVKGIGKETADSIILYALEKPVFVVDAYTKRLFKRLGLLNGNENYDQIKVLVENEFNKLGASVKDYNEFHALIVVHCKEVCRKKPLCSDCELTICPLK